jgi:hypothetical protein
MVATVTLRSKFTVNITAITLSPTSVETVAHGLGAIPTFVPAPRLIATGANTSLSTAIAVVTVDATNIVYQNVGGSLAGWAHDVMVVHSIQE